MITRAKKYCVLCAENKALRYAVRNSNIRKKQTFLCDLLKEEYINIEEYISKISPVRRDTETIDE